VVECNCTNIRKQDRSGFSYMDLNPIFGIVTPEIITPSSPKPKIFKNLKKPVFSEIPLLFYPEGNEEILKAQDAKRQTPGYSLCKNTVFTENITYFFQLPDVNFRYINSILTCKEGFKKQLCKHFVIDTGKREGNC
jgi:hypothetical protein